MLYTKLRCLFISLFLFTVVLYAQEDVLVLDPFQDVDDQLIADTTANNGILPNRVYELKRGEFYLQDAIFNVPQGSTLRFRAEAGTGTKPVIYLNIVSGTGRPPGNWVVLNGGNLEIKDVCIVGYFEDDWDAGLAGIQGGLINTTVAGSTLILDGCILSNVNGQPIRCGATVTRLEVTNTIFSNMGALTRSNFGAGKGIDLREVAHDTVIVENCTFVNFQDRAIRHLDLGTGAPGAIKYLKFNHNTLINGMGFHGTLSLGSVGDQVILTNNLFVDAFALGEDSTDITRSGEWLNTGEKYPNGNNRMTWVLSVPNDVTQWTVSNNYYAISPEGQAWLNEDHFGNGPFNVGSPLSYHINSKLGADSVNAFVREDAIVLNNKPALMTNLMTWYQDPAHGNRTKTVTDFIPTRDDFDRRKVEYFRDTLNAAYQNTTQAYTGSDNRLPVGDLNWFPGVTPPVDLITVDGMKDDFYSTLTGPDDGYLQIRWFAYNQNGRPADDADLSAKVWFAWDSEWLYTYAEVKDNVVNVNNTANEWANDCLELKFDAQPKDSTRNSIWPVTLTALGNGFPGVPAGADADSMNNVAAANKKFARNILIDGGYALELALKWSAIGHNDPEQNESINAAVDSIFGLSVSIHDNDVSARRASVMWAAVMNDQVWNTPKYLGTAKLLADNKLQLIPQNTMTPWRVNSLPYDGSDIVGVEENPQKPIEFSLKQNYPNPFNPTTQIVYSIPGPTKVTLSIYNTLGQEVATLVNQDQNTGVYSITWDGKNASGVGLSSGVYFYQIRTNSTVVTKKMQLLK